MSFFNEDDFFSDDFYSEDMCEIPDPDECSSEPDNIGPDESLIVNPRDSVVRELMDDYERNELEYAERMVHEFPSSSFILANCLKRTIDGKDYENAKYYYDRLSKLPHEKYGINAYVEAIKFLLLDPVLNEETIRSLLEEFKAKHPDNETCYVLWGSLECKVGNTKEAFGILENAVNTIPSAPEAALLLVRLQLKTKLFDKAVETTTKSFASCISSDDDELAPLLSMYNLMAHDGWMHNRIAAGDSVSKEDILLLRQRYCVLLESFPVLRCFDYRKKIEERIGSLDFLLSAMGTT